MFEFDAGKLLIIGVVALIVIGPKDLPRVLRQVGQTVTKLRRMAAEFQSQFMDAMREAELDDIRSDVEKLGEQTNIQSTFNPLHTVRRELTQALQDRPSEQHRSDEVIGAPELTLNGLDEAVGEHVDFSAAAAAPVAAAPALETGEPGLTPEGEPSSEPLHAQASGAPEIAESSSAHLDAAGDMSAKASFEPDLDALAPRRASGS